MSFAVVLGLGLVAASRAVGPGIAIVTRAAVFVRGCGVARRIGAARLDIVADGAVGPG
jgi:hypothetical protein